MQSSKKQQRDKKAFLTKPYKKKKKKENIDWERLDFCKKIRDTKDNISRKNGHNKG